MECPGRGFLTLNPSEKQEHAGDSPYNPDPGYFQKSVAV